MKENKKHFNLIEICEYIDNTNIDDSSGYQLKSMIVDFVQSAKNEAVNELVEEIKAMTAADEKTPLYLDDIIWIAEIITESRKFVSNIIDTKNRKNNNFNKNGGKIC